MYAVTTQDRCATPPRSPTIRGSAVLTIRLSSMASRMASSSPGRMIITSRGGRNCPPDPSAEAAAPEPPCCPFTPGPVVSDTLYLPTRLRAPCEAPPSLVAPSSLLSPGTAGAPWLAGARPRHDRLCYLPAG